MRQEHAEDERERDGEGASVHEVPSPADGVDVTLIRWMLSLSPAERLEVLQRHVNSVLRLRDRMT